MNRFKYLIAFLIIPVLASAQCDPQDVFSNTTSNEVCTETQGAIRYFYSNSLPDHNTGTFPNSGNPHSISAQELSVTMCSEPTDASSITYLDEGDGDCPYWEFGIGMNGIIFDPIAAEYFENPNNGQLNTNWNLNAISSNNNLGLDFNDAHVQPTGKYHYHGFTTDLATSLGVSAGSHSPLLGYAADGYPIYGLYGYQDPNDSSSPIIELTPSYDLKSGTRPGDGVTAPDGAYDGTYTQDYEYNAGSGDLDECNGRTGVTPEFPNGTYYYVLTTDFPAVPRCLMGVPDKSFTIGPPSMGCATSNASSICTTTGVSGQREVNQIILYPNPTHNTVTISNLLEVDAINVYDVEGTLVARSAYRNRQIDLSELRPGNYFVHVSSGSESYMRRIIKE